MAKHDARDSEAASDGETASDAAVTGGGEVEMDDRDAAEEMLNAEEKEVAEARHASWRGRVRRYAPVVLWIGFIFFASSDNMSASKTSRIVRPLLLWLVPDITEAGLLYAHFLVRKAAHLTEYALLAWLSARAFLTSSRGLLRRRWLAASLALVALCALLDEYHQSFLASRTGTIYDSLLDTTGGAIALALVVLWRKLGQRRRAGKRAS